MKKLLICFCLLAHVAAAQTTYKVFANRGNVTVSEGQSYRPIKTGESLTDKHSIKMTDGDYVCLYSVEKGSTTEFKKGGEYRISDIKPKQSPSMVSKYTDFILSSNSAEEKRNRMAATGAVHRGTANSKIKLLLPRVKYNKVVGDQLFLSWSYAQHKKFETKYTVRVQNMMEDDLKVYNTNDTTITVSMSKINPYGDPSILISVEAEGFSSDSKPVNVADDELKKRINAEISQLDLEFHDSKVFRTLVLCSFYEQYGLLIDATNAYATALSDPETEPVVRSHYQDFLVRNGIKQ